MAVLLLDRLWLNLLSSGEAVSGYGEIGRTSEFSMAGEVRGYAGGRQRAATVEGERATYSFVLNDMSLAARDTLRSWFGQNVQVRDHRGQIFRGVFFSTGLTERTYDLDYYQIAITLQTTSTDEGV